MTKEKNPPVLTTNSVTRYKVSFKIKLIINILKHIDDDIMMITSLLSKFHYFVLHRLRKFAIFSYDRIIKFTIFLLSFDEIRVFFRSPLTIFSLFCGRWMNLICFATFTKISIFFRNQLLKPFLFVPEIFWRKSWSFLLDS